jgi:MscS family membrane protein
MHGAPSWLDWAGTQIPAWLDARLFTVALWKWLALLSLVVVAFAASWVAAALIVHLVRPVVQRSRTALDERLLEAAVGPLRLGLALAVFAAGALLVPLAPPIHALLQGIERMAVTLAVAWLLLRVIDLLAAAARARLAAGGRDGAAAMVPVGGKAAKVAILGLALLAVLQNVGVNITGILAGLGIGGLAVALAAQKTVENVFGGITLILDQPVRVGDFCRFGDRVGTVEEIGLRSTRIRTLDRTVVAVPNGEFVTLHLENFTRRDRIWLRTTLGLRYETTPDQLRHVLVEIRSMLYAHPRIDPAPARIRFVGFGAHSLDLEIFAYVQTTSFDEFLAVQEDVYLRIMDIVAASGTGFAFPSQTLYLASDTGLDGARARDAEARVRAWRERGDLYLPEFPPERVQALRASLDYPPDGAAVSRKA